jgi:hypothetical protein
MIEWAYNGDQIDRNIDRAGDSRYFRRGKRTASVDAIGDHEHRAMTVGSGGNALRR